MSTTLSDHVRAHAALLVHHLRSSYADRPLTAQDAQVLESMLVHLDEVHTLALSVDEPIDSPSPSGDPDWYPQLVSRLQARMPHLVEPGARVAVISRGDPALTRLAGVQASHLPKTDSGVWVGYHPANGTDALGHVLRAHEEGAEYLLVPSPSRWWLSYYGELEDFLRANCHVVADDDDLVVYRLPRASYTAVDPATETYRRQLHDYLAFADLLLPVGATVCVVSRGDDAWLKLDGRRCLHFPATPEGTYLGHPADDDDAIAHLHRATRAGATYLAVPAAFAWWERVYPRFFAHLWESYSCVAARADVSWLFDLARPPHRMETLPR